MDGTVVLMHTGVVIGVYVCLQYKKGYSRYL